MDVRVDESGERVQACCLDHLGARRRFERARRADLGDLATADQQVVVAVYPRARIDDLGTADQRVRGLRGRPVQARRSHARLVHGVHAAPPIGAGAGDSGAASGIGSFAPLSTSKSTAIRTTTPDSTCWVISAWGESIASAL